MLHSAFQKLGETREGLDVGLLCYTHYLTGRHWQRGEPWTSSMLLVRFLGNTGVLQSNRESNTMNQTEEAHRSPLPVGTSAFSLQKGNKQPYK